jgi:hypothetical protein
MQSVNRTVTATASGVEILFVIGCVVLNGAAGAVSGALVGTGRQMQYGGGDSSGGAVLGFLIGAVIGLVIASLIVSMSMNLREIALNTRQLVELNGGTSSVTIPEIRPEPAVKRRDDPRFKQFSDAATELSEHSKIALNQAKQEGYTLRIDASGRVVIMERGREGQFHFASNGDIEDLAREKGWI